MPAPFVCPHCQSSLKTNKAMPAGLEVLCPKCKTFFKVPAGGIAAAKVAVGVGAGISGAGDSGISAGRPSPGSFKPGHPPTKNDQDAPAQPSSQGRKFAAIAAGGVLLLAGIIGLIVWASSGSSDSHSHEVADQDKDKGKGKKPNDDVDEIPKIGGGGKKTEPGRAKTLSELTAEEEAKVKAMKGVALAWFKKAQERDGNWAPMGIEFTGLAGLALIECGVPVSDPVVQKAAVNVRKSFLEFRKDVPVIKDPYPICFSMLFLNKLGDPQDEALIKHLTMRIVLNQSVNGGWGYDCPLIPADLEAETFAFLKDLGNKTWDEYRADNPEKVAKMSDRVKKLAVLQAIPVPAPPSFFLDPEDNSHTQVAMLALWAVRKKMPVDQCLRRTVLRFRESQQEDGGWLYKRGDKGQAGGVSMTCAGLLALAIGHALEVEKNPELKKQKVSDKQIVAGMKFIGNYIRKYDPKKDQSLNMYALWSMERVGLLFQQKEIDGQDWYRFGMRILEKKQDPEGSWRLTLPATVDTSFAMLFLQQANLAPGLADAIKELDLGGPLPALIPKN